MASHDHHYPQAPMYEFDSAYHRLRVTDNDGIRMLRFERNRQSSMYIDDPFETDMEYPGYFHLTMAVKPDARRTLVIGLGGGSVVKRMWRDYPSMHIDVVELDPDIVEIARLFFSLPEDERIAVFVDDGRNFIDFAEGEYDVVIIDAFDDDSVPRPLLTDEFLRQVRDHLSPDGVLAYNFIGALYGPRSKPFRSLHRTAGNIWRQLWVFPIGFADDVTDKTRNIIMLATDTRFPAEELLERIASRVDGLVSVPKFERFGEDLYRGKIRSGDVPLIVDHRAERHTRRRR